MLTETIPKLRISEQMINNSITDGYTLEGPDRSGFLYASFSEDQGIIRIMLDYQGSQHILLEDNYNGLTSASDVDQHLRKRLIMASQEAFSVMYD